MKLYGDESNSVILKELGQRIKDIRIGRNMKQSELANAAGVAVITVSRIEDGRSTNIENLMLVLRVLGLLKNMELLVPEQELTPVEVFQNKTKRKRASKKQENDNSDWKWGDER